MVIDRKNDPKADTGGFELIYRQNIPPSPAYMGLNLALKGQQLTQKAANATLSRKEASTPSLLPWKHTDGLRATRSGRPPLAEKQAMPQHSQLVMDVHECFDARNNNGKSAAAGKQQARLTKTRTKLDLTELKQKVSTRRHHSCGPVLSSRTAAANTPRDPAVPLAATVDRATLLSKLEKDLTCIGSKFCPDKLILETDRPPSPGPSSPSSRKSSYEYETIAYKAKCMPNGGGGGCRKTPKVRDQHLAGAPKKEIATS